MIVRDYFEVESLREESVGGVRQPAVANPVGNALPGPPSLSGDEPAETLGLLGWMCHLWRSILGGRSSGSNLIRSEERRCDDGVF